MGHRKFAEVWLTYINAIARFLLVDTEKWTMIHGIDNQSVIS